MNSEIQKLISELEKKKLQNIIIEDPITKKKLTFNITNRKTLIRALNLFKKEPITIYWIRNFKKNSIFYDIGANIGQFTIFAGIVSNAYIYSFEPESNNFQGLMQNIHSNNLYHRVNAFPIGISDTTKFTKLYLNSFSAADSHHSVNYKLDSDLKDKDFKYFQGILTKFQKNSS